MPVWYDPFETSTPFIRHPFKTGDPFDTVPFRAGHLDIEVHPLLQINEYRLTYVYRAHANNEPVTFSFGRQFIYLVCIGERSVGFILLKLTSIHKPK